MLTVLKMAGNNTINNNGEQWDEERRESSAVVLTVRTVNDQAISIAWEQVRNMASEPPSPNHRWPRAGPGICVRQGLLVILTLPKFCQALFWAGSQVSG